MVGKDHPPDLASLVPSELPSLPESVVENDTPAQLSAQNNVPKEKKPKHPPGEPQCRMHRCNIFTRIENICNLVAFSFRLYLCNSYCHRMFVFNCNNQVKSIVSLMKC